MPGRIDPHSKDCSSEPLYSSRNVSVSKVAQKYTSATSARVTLSHCITEGGKLRSYWDASVTGSFKMFVI